MAPLDKSSSLFFLAVAVYSSIEAYSLGLGSLSDPDAGLFPFVLSVFLGIFSILTGIQAKVPLSRAVGDTARILWNWKWRNPLLVTAVLLAYAAFLESIGFLLCTLAALFLLSLIVESKRLGLALFIAAASTAGAYIVFQLLIKANLPRGLL